jgi:hypothetical protein
LIGVAVGTTVPYLLGSPYVIGLALSTFAVSARRFAREAWLPAYSTGLLLAVCLIVVRLSAPLNTLPIVLAVGATGVLGYWAIFFGVWLKPDERRLIGETTRAFIRR